MSAATCTQPGCTGTVEDGYCNVCGSPAAAGRSAADPSRCTQPGCTGAIEDGYCNVCGTPAAPGSTGSAGYSTPTVAPEAAAVAAGARESDRSSSTSSSRLQSAPLGSARGGRGTRPTRRIGTAGSRSQRQLGAGITTVPSAPVADPHTAIMQLAEVAENKRFCSSCGAPVGRGRAGRPGKPQGFCPKCRTEFSFVPKLKTGDMVGGQYDVLGALAHGGLGWLYLARDRNVSDRWVVLKGLLNTGDRDAYAAAVAERQFLAEVQHPLILGIYNFAMYENAGYIVMEYVGGKSLKSILKDRQEAAGRYDPLPPDQAIAYMVEIMPALSYLHSQGLLYCDLKPDNVIQAGDSVKLIDLGGVRRVDDEQSAIYGTVGFQAPEIATLGPSVASDIFTIGRTLAVLAMEFRGYQSTYATTLPPVDDVPLFARYDSLYRVIAKACATDPNDRFQSVDEMRDQLVAVLREVVAHERTDTKAATVTTPSPLFAPPRTAGDNLDWADLPDLHIDAADPAAAWLASVSIADPQQRLAALGQAPEQTVEVALAQSRTAVDAGRFDLVDRTLEGILRLDAWEWRAVWLGGIAALARGDARTATASFNAVLSQVPGELAPKLALALACELSGERELATNLYRTCTVIDAAYVSPAAFGLSRTRNALGDLDGALDALDLVAPTSASYLDARRRRAGLLATSGTGLRALSDAADTISGLPIGPRERQLVIVDVLRKALEEVRRTRREDPARHIAGVPATERDLRGGTETAYRHLAALTTEHSERVKLIDEANAVRPRTLV